MSSQIFSLGHSDLPFEKFVGLLKKSEISAVADVRSSPFSKRAPWFSQGEFRESLRSHRIAYAFLGKELGGRPNSDRLFRDGIADYEAMAREDNFKSGIERLIKGKASHRIAMVCSERDPLECHRCLLVGRKLMDCGVMTTHIHYDGRLESQEEAECRLLKEERLFEDDFLRTKHERISQAYGQRNRQVAYSLLMKDRTDKVWSERRI